jgi:hypothetical protein
MAEGDAVMRQGRAGIIDDAQLGRERDPALAQLLLDTLLVGCIGEAGWQGTLGHAQRLGHAPGLRDLDAVALLQRIDQRARGFGAGDQSGPQLGSLRTLRSR